MARKPEATWKMLNVAMAYFQEYIHSKKNRSSLSIVDLLHVSNFKGGNASITEPQASLPIKLNAYESVLKKIEIIFSGKALRELSSAELDTLIELCDEFLALTITESSAIRGFGPSYASAILAAHFLELIPVLDRRALNGAGISVVYNSQKQVKNIASHYGQLIRAFHAELKRRPDISARQLDREWFTTSF